MIVNGIRYDGDLAASLLTSKENLAKLRLVVPEDIIETKVYDTSKSGVENVQLSSKYIVNLIKTFRNVKPISISHPAPIWWIVFKTEKSCQVAEVSVDITESGSSTVAYFELTMRKSGKLIGDTYLYSSSGLEAWVRNLSPGLGALKYLESS